MRLKKSSLLIVFFLLIASFLVIRFTFNQLNYLKFDNNSLKSRFFFKNPNLPRIIVVIGTRPEAVKCAPLIAELKKEQYKTSFEVIVLSTGQHREILKQTLNSFNQKVDIDLDLMTTNQDLSQFFTSAYQKLTLEFKSLSPISLVVVQGDTTTALAAALAASYLHIQVAHVEAGLRSYDMENPFPEETNRRLIDAVSRLMLAPTEYSKQALINEGICPSDIFVTGNTGIDAFYSLQSKNLTEMPQILKEIQNFNPKKSSNKFVILVTMHRRENFQYMKDMCLAIKQIAEKYLKNVLIIFPVHPNPNVRQIVNGYLKNLVNVQIIEPISYDIFPHVLKESDIILTDSGGIQEESSSIGKSVILMRETTERPEGIYLGTIQQIGVKLENIVAAVEKALNSDKNQITKKDIFGDGLASERTAKIFQEYIEGKLKKDINCLTKSKQDALANQVFHQNKTSKL